MSSKASASKLKPRRAAAEQDVAIVGIGCRFPEAENYSSYWNNMINHVNSVKPISYDRWQNGRYGLKNEADLGWDNEQFVKYCASLSGIDKFDNTFLTCHPERWRAWTPSSGFCWKKHGIVLRIQGFRCMISRRNGLLCMSELPAMTTV